GTGAAVGAASVEFPADPAAASLGTPSARPVRRPRHPPRLAFSTLACPQWSLARVISAAREYGYQGVEIRLLAGEVDLLACPELSPARRRETRQLFADQGVSVCGLASSVRFDHESHSDLMRELDVGRRYLELAADLGAGFVRIFGDKLPSLDNLRERDLRVTKIASYIEVLADFAHRQAGGARLLVETHGDFVESEWMTRLVRRVGSPALGVLWDTHHPWRFAGEPLAETTRRLGAWVGHTHWKDSPGTPVPPAVVQGAVGGQGGASGTTGASPSAIERMAQLAGTLMSGHRPASYCLFGEGEFPVIDCLRELAAIGYNGWYSLEWEKAWHPELADPELALPQFPPRFLALWQAAFERTP
ncbi:MAG: sugar phosphate isomerase/epimerase family protein, partial [Planctomycetaceae bacterium]